MSDAGGGVAVGAEAARFVLADLLSSSSNFENLTFEPFRPGVEIARIYGRGPEECSAALLRYAPGARVPLHRHIGFEHIFVLHGSQSDELGTYERGALVIHAPGTEHRVQSEHGCVVLAVWEKPVRIMEEDA